MALPVLDGNQSATTLSSVVTGGEHIVAHSVVSLGTAAISNITSAVSGVVVTIPPLAHLGNSVATDGALDTTTNFIKIGGHQSGANQTAHIVHVSNGGAMSVDASGSSVTFSQASVTFGAITGSASILNFPSTQTIAGTVTANGGDFVFSESQDTSFAKGVLIGFEDDASAEYRKVTDVQPLPISINAIVNAGGFGASLPVSGTVTANVFGYDSPNDAFVPIPVHNINEGFAAGNNAIPALIGNEFGGFNNANPLPVLGTVTIGNSVTISSLPAISGTVTANVDVGSRIRILDSNGEDIVVNSTNGALEVNVKNSVTIGSLPAISGTVTANGGDFTHTDETGFDGLSKLVLVAGRDQTNELIRAIPLTAGGAGVVAEVSGTVTVGSSVTVSALPSGALTTRFGSVTTANTAQITSAVTNTSRKYLLAQNISTGSVTIGIGFSPTTTQGIQLTAGGGLTFDAFCPTGAVYWLGAVTGAAYTILEG